MDDIDKHIYLLQNDAHSNCRITLHFLTWGKRHSIQPSWLRVGQQIQNAKQRWCSGAGGGLNHKISKWALPPST